MKLTVTADVRAIQRKIKKFEKQIPFAESRAINDSAMAVSKAQRSVAAKTFDRPKPWTLNKIYDPSKKGYSRFSGRKSDKKDFPRPYATLTPGYPRGVEGKQYEWSARVNRLFLLQAKGGTVTPSGRAFPVPTKLTPKNQYGSFQGQRKGYVARTIARKKTFQLGAPDVSKNRAGVYERVGRGKSKQTRMLIAWESSLRYKAIYPYFETFRRVYPSAIRKAFDRRFKEARKTAFSNA